VQVNAKRYKIRVTHTTQKVALAFTIQIFMMAPGLHMVDFRKGLGDIGEFHGFYKQMYLVKLYPFMDNDFSYI
jgi:hypothetical protein